MSAAVGTPVRDGTAIVEAVTKLAPVFRHREPESEARRSVPRESIEDLIDSGMYRMLTPALWGGYELRIRDFVLATAAAAKGSPSTGWLAGQMSFAPLVLGAFGAEAQAAVWGANPDAILASTTVGLTARPVAGGFRISGKGPFASGVNHADWLYLGAPVIEDSATESSIAPDIRFFLVPTSEVTIVDTWHTAAMRGTGSNTVVLDDVFVPAALSMYAADQREGVGPGIGPDTSYLYKVPWIAVVPLIYTSTMLGSTQAAYEVLVSSLANKRSASGERSADSEDVQIQVAFASAKIDAAECLLLSIADRADSGLEYSLLERAAVVRTASFVTSILMEAIDMVLGLGGTASFGESNYLQQAWRDVHFAAAHQSLSKRLQASRYGRLQLGVEDAAKRPLFY